MQPQNINTERPDPEPADSPGDEWKQLSMKERRKMMKRTESAKSTFMESPYERKWSCFRDLKLDGNVALRSSNPNLLAHAKIYVFAERYLIDSLRNQCLKSLHRDLCNFSLNLQNMKQILDLLKYTYEQTSRQSSAGTNSLRSVVIHYASCEIRTLVKDTRFRSLLDDFGEMGSELVGHLIY
jgi:hypothetical protein